VNKHIELTKKYLADNDSVTLQELKNSLSTTYAAADAAHNFWDVKATIAVYAAVAAARDAKVAANVVADEVDAAARWVKKYEALINE
jgi:hypothetical protein